MWRNKDTFMAQSLTESLVQACLNSHSVRGYEAFKSSNSMKKDRKLSRNIYKKKYQYFSRKALRSYLLSYQAAALEKQNVSFTKPRWINSFFNTVVCI